jgi:hypothetical protein
MSRASVLCGELFAKKLDEVVVDLQVKLDYTGQK